MRQWGRRGGEGKCGTGGGDALGNGYTGGGDRGGRREEGGRGGAPVCYQVLFRAGGCLVVREEAWLEFVCVDVPPRWIDGYERPTSPICFQTPSRTTRRGSRSPIQMFQNQIGG